MVATGRLTREGTALRKFALSYPEATEHMPWGHHAIKVKGKSFLFLAADAETFSLSAKLPSSGGVALKLPFASPTEYGLGRSGWVTARFPAAPESRSTYCGSGWTRATALSPPSAWWRGSARTSRRSPQIDPAPRPFCLLNTARRSFMPSVSSLTATARRHSAT